MSRILIELHCHTQDHSYDGRIAAEEMVRILVKKKFAGVVITEHSYIWPMEELEELRTKAGAPRSFLMLSGQEVRCTLNEVVLGDLLVYGAERNLPDGTSPLEIFEILKATGGFCTAPHAGVPRIGFGDQVRSFPITAVETWNGRYGPIAAANSRIIAEESGLPIVGGSDSHKEDEVGGGGTIFPRMPASLQDIKHMIEGGECKPWQPGPLDKALRWIKARNSEDD
ncbi:hypothetical protein BH09SUM1_BH09SUM1_05490 [soil metagenome]